jgi:3-oxoacyl-[acyl-carrier protein] reductase
LRRRVAHVAVNNRSEDAGHAVVEEITSAGGSAIVHRGDVGRTSDAEELVDLALRMWGHLDIVVNNAGQSIAGTSKRTIRRSGNPANVPI